MGNGVLVLGATAAAALVAGGCTGKQRPVSVMLDNQSSVHMEVQVDLPVRGPLARRPNHEAYRTLLPPGYSWENAPDTLRFATAPNEVKGFRVMVADIGGEQYVWYTPFAIPGSRKACHVIFRGEPGAITWETAGGEAQPLQKSDHEWTPGVSPAE
jgi:hypothetical protein